MSTHSNALCVLGPTDHATPSTDRSGPAPSSSRESTRRHRLCRRHRDVLPASRLEAASAPRLARGRLSDSTSGDSVRRYHHTRRQARFPGRGGQGPAAWRGRRRWQGRRRRGRVARDRRESGVSALSARESPRGGTRRGDDHLVDAVAAAAASGGPRLESFVHLDVVFVVVFDPGAENAQSRWRHSTPERACGGVLAQAQGIPRRRRRRKSAFVVAGTRVDAPGRREPPGAATLSGQAGRTRRGVDRRQGKEGHASDLVYRVRWQAS